MIENTNVYEEELKQMLLVWVFNFTCATCIMAENSSEFKYITPEIESDHDLGVFSSPPIIWCGCNESLYNIKSHGLYELFESLYEKNEQGNILIQSFEPKETEIKESFTFTQTENL